MALEEYRRKRDFTTTPEPSGDERRQAPLTDTEAAGTAAWDTLPKGRRYCVQQHRATRMHYDFRLEHAGVLLSWPIPRGPTLDPAIRRLAVHTEDHPVDYGDFEGVIPSGYGAGTVLLWDIGTYEWLRETADDFAVSYAKGDLKFRLDGIKLRGEFALIRIGDRGRRGRERGGEVDGDKNWLFLKKRDDAVIQGYEAGEHEVSVKTGRSLAQIAEAAGGDPRQMARAARSGGARSVPTRGGDAGRPTSSPHHLPTGAASPLPRPMLATSVEQPFTREGWLFELKWDGVRAIAAVESDSLRVLGRSGRDETARYPELAELGAALRGRSAVVDGEIVVLDQDGRPSFERLQSRINVSRDSDVRQAMRRDPATFVVFDILSLDGRDLSSTALRIRKKTLHDVLRPSAHVLYADHVERDGETFFTAVRRRGIEGVVAKRADSSYQPGRRSPDWLKVKAWQTQSCVIAGYTAGRGRRMDQLGALILGVYKGTVLQHCGQVGTGFDEATLRGLRQRFSTVRADSSPLATVPRTSEPATWVLPRLVCEVRHAGWTKQGLLRHPAYLGLREDVSPRECRRETPALLGEVLPAEVLPAEGAADSPAPGATEDAAQATDGEVTAPRSPDPRPRAPRAGVPPRSKRQGSGRSDSQSTLQPTATSLPLRADLLEQLRSLRANDLLEVEGRRLRLTNLDKVMWPDDGLTKRDLIAHYINVSEVMLPYLRDRPLSMQVFPDGITGKSFWRKDKPQHAPDWISSWTYHGEKTKEYILVNELATLVWVANSAVIDLHPWHSRFDEPNRPDWAVFDLDPAEGATFESVVIIARLVGVALQHYSLRSVLKTTGQTGLQIFVPIRRGPDYGDVLRWVEGVARAIGRIVPELVSWEWAVSQRTGRVRIDYTQNIINKTLNAPYTVRAVSRAPVSAPIAWDELDDSGLRPDRWTTATISARIAARGDLFHGALQGDQELPPLD